MAILEDHAIPLGDYAPGTYKLGFGPGAQNGGNPRAVPDATTSCDISISRCTTVAPAIWPSASVTIDTIPECSVNGGVTWIECGAARGQTGGVQFVKNNPALGELAFSRSGGSLPAGTNRLWRCTAIVTGGTFHGFANIEVD